MLASVYIFFDSWANKVRSLLATNLQVIPIKFREGYKSLFSIIIMLIRMIKLIN